MSILVFREKGTKTHANEMEAKNKIANSLSRTAMKGSEGGESIPAMNRQVSITKVVYNGDNAYRQ